MARFQDLTGMQFGRLVVIERDTGFTGPGTKWLCQCDCDPNKLVSVRAPSLKSGATQSCGCQELEPENNPTPKHIVKHWIEWLNS